MIFHILDCQDILGGKHIEVYYTGQFSFERSCKNDGTDTYRRCGLEISHECVRLVRLCASSMCGM